MVVPMIMVMMIMMVVVVVVVVMVMVVVVVVMMIACCVAFMLWEEMRIEFSDAVEIEGAAVQNFVQGDRGTLGAINLRRWIDRADRALDIRKLVGADQIGFVQEHDVGEREARSFRDAAHLLDIERIEGLDVRQEAQDQLLRGTAAQGHGIELPRIKLDAQADTARGLSTSAGSAPTRRARWQAASA